MADETRIARLEAEVLRTRRQLKAVVLVLFSLVALGAAAITDQAVRGKLSILDQDGQPKTTLQPNGDVDVGGDLSLRGKLFVAGSNLVERIAKVEQNISKVGGNISTASTQINNIASSNLKYTTFEEQYILPQDIPAYPQTKTLVRGPFGSRVIGAWHEPTYDIVTMESFKVLKIRPKGNNIEVDVQKQSPAGAAVHIRYHVLYVE